MKYFYDCEFIEDGDTIELISIGVVAEDGRSFYRVNYDCDFSRANNWVTENVLPHLPPQPVVLTEENRGPWQPYQEIGAELLEFMGYTLADAKGPWATLRPLKDRATRPADKPELWGYYSAYDHVALCQLFGRMIDLPAGMPMYTRDLKQWCDMLGNPTLPKQATTKHDALADAHWNREVYEFLKAKSGQ